MFVVFWLKSCGGPDCIGFKDDELGKALKFMEELRTEVGSSFVTMCSENPNSVGKPGVAEVGPGYNWTKRRGNMPGLKK